MAACYLCGKDIGWLRSTIDQQYCSDEHRQQSRMASSNVLREEEEEVELWSVSRSKAKRAEAKAANKGISVFAILSLAALTVMVMVLSSGDSGPSAPRTPGTTLDAADKRGLFNRTGDYIGKMIESHAPVTLHHDFSTGLKEWTTVALNTASKVDDPHDWKRPSVPNLVTPGSLRLWSKSTPLKNYQLDFEGAIEKRSLSWVFRATDAGNYYGAKILITKPGPLPNAGLVHYVMLNGHEMDRVQLPLPMTLERGKDYRVRVAVRDDRFITYLNGRVISSWTDARLGRGGVGFFADNSDQQKVSWVSLSERDSFLGQMMAHFSLILVPGAPAFPMGFPLQAELP